MGSIVAGVDEECYKEIIKCAYYWAIIMPIKAEIDKIVIGERNIIKKMWNELHVIYSNVCNEEIEDIDLSNIRSSDFEVLCKYILAELGFENILSGGNTTVLTTTIP